MYSAPYGRKKKENFSLANLLLMVNTYGLNGAALESGEPAACAAQCSAALVDSEGFGPCQ
jgi:hypothetical protein